MNLLQNNMERSEFQTRTKLEAQVASSERELALVKKKLEHEEEERDKRRQAWEQRVTAIAQYCSHACLNFNKIWSLLFDLR